jgi:transposase-like protein
MAVILLRPKKTDAQPGSRPTECPYCGSSLFQRWGEVTKPIKDQRDLNIKIYRYRCETCKRTFRDYPEGVDRSEYSQGIRQLAALIWAVGYSYRNVIHLFKKYGIKLSRTTVWREGQALAEKLPNGVFPSHRKMVTIRHDKVHRIDLKFGVVLIAEIGVGHYEVLGSLDEPNPELVKSWLSPLIQNMEIEVVQFHTRKLELLMDLNQLTKGQILT